MTCHLLFFTVSAIQASHISWSSTAEIWSQCRAALVTHKSKWLLMCILIYRRGQENKCSEIWRTILPEQGYSKGWGGIITGSISCGSTGRTGNVAKAPCKSPNGSTSKIVGKELIKMMGSSQDCPFSFGIWYGKKIVAWYNESVENDWGCNLQHQSRWHIKLEMPNWHFKFRRI